MVIQHNMAATNSYRQLNTNNTSLNKNLEKLSSGFRINRAADDAAGLAISEAMRSKINGLDQAQANANDAIGLIQTEEGALTETHSMLQRMTTLATQAANGTYNTTSRDSIQKELDELGNEINRIA
ncbi:flagellin N-terminal helical region, partial [[Clostridium] aminophilum]